LEKIIFNILSHHAPDGALASRKPYKHQTELIDMEKIKQGFDIAVNEELINGKKIFVAHCLNLGIASQGYSYEDAFENIKDAIKLYLEECPEKIPKRQTQLLPPMATRLFL